MKVIGLCGGSGSGKGTVAKIFNQYAIPSIDADSVYAGLISYRSECMEEIISAFGSKICNADGSLNRSVMRNLIFSSSEGDENRLLLNKITHKYVSIEVDNLLEKYKREGQKFTIIDVPLMFESRFDKKCDILIAVTADKATRIDRIVSRDSISYGQAEDRIASQISDEILIRKTDYAIENNGDINELEKQVVNVLDKINNSKEI